jgi:hypothetical protein
VQQTCEQHCTACAVVCRYHRYTIKETSDSFVLTTHSPGEAQDRQQVLHADFKPELKRCVQ